MKHIYYNVNWYVYYGQYYVINIEVKIRCYNQGKGDIRGSNDVSLKIGHERRSGKWLWVSKKRDRDKYI